MVVLGQELLGHTVVESLKSEPIGEVKDVVVDLDQHMVVGLLLDAWSREARFISYESVLHISEKRVTVRQDAFTPRPLIREWILRLVSQPSPLGRLVLQLPDGMPLGRLIDIYIDTDTKEITGYAVGAGKNQSHHLFILPSRLGHTRPPTEQMKKDSREALVRLLKW